MHTKKEVTYGLIAFTIILVGVSGYFIYQTRDKTDKIVNLEGEQLTLQQQLTTTQAELAEASTTANQLREQLEELTEELEDLADDYRDEKDKNEDFEDQLRDITKTVGVLDKLSKTDEELLQKYSKVYFLNEHYVPESLSSIDKEYLYYEDRDLELHSDVMPYFEEMVEDAKEDGIDLWVVSAYRSYGQQATLKGNYLTTYGSGANAFSADQGYSEHQLGTTVDFTTAGRSGALDGFETTEAYEWLLDNAHKYGFTLSYPEGNSSYIFEPWHWRFVGEDLAKDLARANDHFYDWEQRKIDGYLISIFD